MERIITLIPTLIMYFVATGGLITGIFGFRKNDYFKGATFLFGFFIISGLYSLFISLTQNFFINLFMSGPFSSSTFFWLQALRIPQVILNTAGIATLTVFLIRAVVNYPPLRT